eukprot:tig00000655_g2882.t1
MPPRGKESSGSSPTRIVRRVHAVQLPNYRSSLADAVSVYAGAAPQTVNRRQSASFTSVKSASSSGAPAAKPAGAKLSASASCSKPSTYLNSAVPGKSQGDALVEARRRRQQAAAARSAAAATAASQPDVGPRMNPLMEEGEEAEAGVP